MAGIPAALSLLLELKRAHWRSSVYLIVRVTATNPADAGSDTVIALNLTRPQNGEPSQPIPDEVLRRQELEEQRRQTGQPYLEISHFNGGPVAWSSTRHALLATSATQDALQEDSLMIWPRPDGSSVVCGTFSNVVNFARCCCDGAATGTQLRSFSGYAQWSRAQLLHEIARGSWGVVGATIGVENALPNPGEVWSAMSDLAVHAQDNELSSQYVVNSWTEGKGDLNSRSIRNCRIALTDPGTSLQPQVKMLHSESEAQRTVQNLKAMCRRRSW
jgi:putative AlgH/UPF0301 family transcriptional regulator